MMMAGGTMWGWLGAVVSQLITGLSAPDDSSTYCTVGDLRAGLEHATGTSLDDEVDLGATTQLIVPETLLVSRGAAGAAGVALLTYEEAGATVECTYLGSASHPNFTHDSCSDGRIPGELIDADSVSLSVLSGDPAFGDTWVDLVLDEATCALDLADGPCADAGWGGITYFGNTIHVRTTGDDANDGTIDAPVASMARAHELARQLPWGRATIALGPGEFESVSLDELSDIGTFVQGCSPEETTVVADSDEVGVDLAMFDSGVTSLAIEGGEVGLQLRDLAAVTIRDVVVRGSGVGVRATGGTAGTIRGLTVDATDPVLGCGWGLDLSDTLLLGADVQVQGASGVGMAVRDSTVVVDDLNIMETEGRGVDAESSYVGLLGGTVSGSEEAGVFLRDGLGAVFGSIYIDFTGAGLLGSRGDGLVVVGDATQPPVYVAETETAVSDRAGMIFSGAMVWVGMTSPLGGVDGTYEQDFAQIGGPLAGSVVPPAIPYDLDLNTPTCP